MIRWRQLAALAVVIAACGPKGSNKPAHVEIASTGHIIVRHPNFEGHLSPAFIAEPPRFGVKLEVSGFPEKSELVIEGKTVALPRSGEVDTAVDLALAAGEAPISALKGETRVPFTLPIEMSFFGGRQKFKATLSGVKAYVELRHCLEGVARVRCVFGAEGAPSAKANIVLFSAGDSSPKIFGSPERVRDLDWVAVAETTATIDGRKCKMQRKTSGGIDIDDDLTLVRETERITVHDRRTGAKLHVKELAGPDRCPFVATVKLEGPKAGLRSLVDASDRDRWFAELRGDAPPAAPASSKPPGKSKKRTK